MLSCEVQHRYVLHFYLVYTSGPAISCRAILTIRLFSYPANGCRSRMLRHFDSTGPAQTASKRLLNYMYFDLCM